MKDKLPKGELVLLCNNGYFVEKVLYSDFQLEQKEILHKSLISLADVQSFDAVLQLVSELRAHGSTSGCPIQIILGEFTFNFVFSGTCLHDHIVLTASVEGTDLELIPSLLKSQKNNNSNLYSPGRLASDDLFLMEEINRLKPTS